MAQGVVDLLNRVFRVTVGMGCRGQRLQTSFHVRDFGIPNATVESIHGEIKPWVLAAFRAAMPNDLAIQRLEVQRLIENSYFAEDFIGIAGTTNGGMTTSFMASCVTLKSNLRSRHANGRMFWPFAGTAVNDAATGSVLANLNLAAADMLTRWGGVIIVGEAKLVVVGKPLLGGTPSEANPPRWTDVEQVRVNPIVSALRSRKAGVGS